MGEWLSPGELRVGLGWADVVARLVAFDRQLLAWVHRH